MTEFTAINKSTIFDICLNTYGTLNHVAKLMNDNNHDGVNTLPVAGDVYVFDEKLTTVQLASNVNVNYNVSQAVSKTKYATAP